MEALQISQVLYRIVIDTLGRRLKFIVQPFLDLLLSVPNVIATSLTLFRSGIITDF